MHFNKNASHYKKIKTMVHLGKMCHSWKSWIYKFFQKVRSSVILVFIVSSPFSAEGIINFSLPVEGREKNLLSEHYKFECLGWLGWRIGVVIGTMSAIFWTHGFSRKGPINSASSVRSSVRSFVRNADISGSARQKFLIFCTKLEQHKYVEKWGFLIFEKGS